MTLPPPGDIAMSDVVTMDDLSNEEILSILEDSVRLVPVARGVVHLPSGKVLETCSMKTRPGQECPLRRLRRDWWVCSNFSSIGTSVAKGETLFDTMQMVEGYAVIDVIRHPRLGAAQYSADAIDIPILNAGDGAGNHPTQTMLDLFTIMEAHGTIEGLNVVLVGDLRYGRTVHSLSHALIRFGAELTLVSPETLMMPDEIVNDLRASGATITESTDLVSAIPDADVIYMTRIQKERFPDEDEYAKVAGIYMLSAKDMDDAKDGMIVMHPLPRVSELHPSLDSTVNARYFQQAFNGVPTRMALLCRSLGVEIPEEVKK